MPKTSGSSEGVGSDLGVGGVQVGSVDDVRRLGGSEFRTDFWTLAILAKAVMMNVELQRFLTGSMGSDEVFCFEGLFDFACGS